MMMATAKSSENAPAHPSARIITRFRLNRSATTPPKGLKSATGRSDAADASDSHTGEDVFSVMNQMAAKLAATVAKMDAACPHQITATVASQPFGKGWPVAFKSVFIRFSPSRVSALLLISRTLNYGATP